MTPHPHAEVLRAIADGVPLSEFEASPTNGWCEPSDLYHRIGDMVRFPEKWEIRRKPQHIMVNGFKVPRPIGLNAGQHLVYAPNVMGDLYFSEWENPVNITTAIKRGVAHATKEAAIAHAKAMLGIDPEYFK